MTRIVKKNTDFYPLLSIILIIYLIVINNVVNSLLSIIAIMIGAIFIINPLYILPPLFLSSLAGNYFVAFHGIGFSRILVIIFIIGSFLKFVTSNTKFKLSHVVFLFVICGFNFISAATSITGSITPALTMTLNIVMMFFMMYTQVDDLNMFLKTFSISIFIFTLYITIKVILDDSITVNDKGIDRLILDEELNANSVGMALAQMSAFIFGGLVLVKEKKKKIIYVAIILLNILNLILTGSRSAMIAIVASMVIVYFIGHFKLNKISKKNFLFIIIFIFMVGLYYGISNSEIDIIQRFSIMNIIETRGTGRLIIWEALIKYVIPQHLWFGVGLGGENVFIAITPYIPVPHGAHNLILTIITETGIVGSILYFSFFFKSTKTILKNRLKTDYLMIPLTMVLAAFVNGIGENIFTERYLWFGIGLGFMLLNNTRNRASEFLP